MSSGGPRVVRGRVIARTGDTLLLRCRNGDIRVRPAGRAAPGDLVEHRTGEPPTIVRSYLRGDYPTPETETARLSRPRIRNLEKRARALASARRFFGQRDFLEVETPLMVPTPGLEVNIDAVPAGADRWLITSPEFQMKRLLSAGLERIFTLCKCFRDNESGPQHAMEFTMLEWYRVWSDIEAIASDTEELVAQVARDVAGSTVLHVGGRRVDVATPWPRMTVVEAMGRFAGVAMVGDESAAELAACLERAGIDVGSAVAWDDLFYIAFVSRVEPALAELDTPVLITDWPLPLAALARRKVGEPWLVERFEAYVGGMELANAFGELTDPVEQRARFVDEQLTRKERGRPVYSIDEKLIRALEEGMPPSAGVALGIDRLVMLICGAELISEVQTFGPGES